jgi:dihydroorotate dehydrogenase (NAD+) catalytic subunit
MSGASKAGRSSQPEHGAGGLKLCGIPLAHPVINGSGTFDLRTALSLFGRELLDAPPFAAYVSKTITVAPRRGNPPPRLWEAPAGLVNSIGLPNPGLQGYLERELPLFEELSVPLITNVMGSSVAEIRELFAACSEQPAVAAVELNVSCPNVKDGLEIGSNPRTLHAILEASRAELRKPLIVKLTPNAADVPSCALAAQEGGADALSLINTLRAAAMRPDGRPWLGARSGGLSGPAIRSVALAQVAAVAERVSIPVIGMGGIQSAEHARSFLAAGASIVAVGTESFRDPFVGARIAAGLQRPSGAVSLKRGGALEGFEGVGNDRSRPMRAAWSERIE